MKGLERGSDWGENHGVIGREKGGLGVGRKRCLGKGNREKNNE